MSAAHHLDRAVQSAEDDLLERGLFIERLGNALVAKDNSRATGVVVGITGEWGSGKSSILNLAAKHLEDKRKAVVVQFDPWVVSGRDDLIRRLLIEVAKKLGRDERTKGIANSVLKYVEALAPAAGVAGSVFGIPGLNVALTWTTKLAKKFLAEPSLDERHDALVEALEDAKAPIVVMIDELDRLDDGEIRAMAQFVRAVGDFDRISYLLAYDQRRVAEALGDGDSDRGLSYLEKIVQYQIPLPVTSPRELHRLLDRALDTITQDRELPAPWRSDPRHDELLNLLIPGILDTPRDIRRFGGMFDIQCAMLDEVSLIDLMGWAALLTKAPRIVQAIRQTPALVGGPNLSLGQEHEFYAWQQRSLEDRLDALALPRETREPLTNLLRFLFPTPLGNNVNTADRHPDCLCFDRPLMTVLRYGMPPGHFSRAEIWRFLSADYAVRRDVLDRAIAEDTLPLFIARFGELYGDFADLDHTQIWLDLARHISENASPWPARMTPFHNLGGRFLDAVLRNRRISDHVVVHLRDMVDALEAADDIHILPELVFDHFWIYGLYNCRQYDRPAILSEAETVALAERLAAHMVQRFLDEPDLVGRLRTSIFFPDLSLLGAWTEECRDRLTDLAQGPQLDSIVLLFFGGNQIVGASSLDRLLDLAVVLGRARQRYAAGFDNDHPSLHAAYFTLVERGLPPD
ncbi:MAG: hypothetical protein FD176_2629 [Rhodospirillaceae bacterium]|nr:MAG: hypothetical protein FD176_2629 [Rhodospirillaceae bacterium]TNC97150.1 MAG: hypothetical protein FD119_1242 [Stygiobacter sp.]